jgi:hypothetical protein
MAHRRKKSSHRKHRRHRVGAINVKQVGMKVLGVAAGAFAARTLYNVVVKNYPTIAPQYIGLGEVALGVLVPKFIKNDIGGGIGDGLIAIGSLTAMQNFGLINGIGAVAPRRVPARVIGAGARPFLSKMVGGGMGATARPYTRTTVGNAYSEMEAMNRASMGALYMED